MGFNYAKEKRIFEAEWQKLEAEYLAIGFDEDGIKAMYDFDWELFRQRRIYVNREQAFPSETIDGSDDKSRSSLLQKFPALTTILDDNMPMSRYGWIEDIANPILADKLAKLADAQKELLTLLVFGKYTQKEIAAIYECSQSAISKRIKRLKIFLR